MEVAVVKGAGGRHRAVATAADRSVRFRVHDYGVHLPHDLAHLVVERELGLPSGFWGLLAAGAELDSVRAAGARHPRHLPPARDPLVTAHAADLDRAERLVAELYPLHRPPGPVAGLTPEVVTAVQWRLDHLNRRWQALADGEALHLAWPGTPGG